MAENKQYYIPTQEGDIEVTEEVYRAYYKGERQTRYIAEKDQAHDVSHYDLAALEKLSCPNVNEISNSSMEDDLITRELYDHLHRCVDALPRAERELIKAIYYEGKTETEYAESIGISQSGISRQRKKILLKMRKFMDFLGSFPEFVIFSSEFGSLYEGIILRL